MNNYDPEKEKEKLRQIFTEEEISKMDLSKPDDAPLKILTDTKSNPKIRFMKALEEGGKQISTGSYKGLATRFGRRLDSNIATCCIFYKPDHLPEDTYIISLDEAMHKTKDLEFKEGEKYYKVEKVDFKKLTNIPCIINEQDGKDFYPVLLNLPIFICKLKEIPEMTAGKEDRNVMSATVRAIKEQHGMDLLLDGYNLDEAEELHDKKIEETLRELFKLEKQEGIDTVKKNFGESFTEEDLKRIDDFLGKG